MAFYDTTAVWQWMRLPGGVLFAVAAVLMALDFLIKPASALPATCRALARSTHGDEPEGGSLRRLRSCHVGRGEVN